MTAGSVTSPVTSSQYSAPITDNLLSSLYARSTPDLRGGVVV